MTHFRSLALVLSLLSSFNLLASTLPNSDIRDLGIAYLSQHGLVTQSSCVAGERKEVLSGGSHLAYTLDGDYENILKTISGSLSLGIEIPVVGSVEGMAKVAWQHASTKNSTSWNYIFQAQAYSEVYKQGTEHLTDEIQKRVANEPNLNLYDVCGDEYISRVDYGASLIVSLVVEFFKTSDKTQVEGKLRANFDFTALKAKGEANLNLDLQNMNDRVKVHVVANQFGGDHGALSSLLTDNIVDCSLDKFDKCLDTVRKILDYANKDFAEQIKKDSKKYAVLRYHTTPYRDNLSVSRLASSHSDVVSAAVWARRQDLMAESENHRELFARTLNLLSKWKGFLVQNELLEKIKGVKQVLQKNLRNISKDIGTCFRFPEQCLELHPVREEFDETLLDLKDATTPQEMLFEAAKANDVQKMYAAIQLRGANPILTTVGGNNALHIAAQHGHTSVTSALVRQKPELLESQNADGQTAFCLATVNGHVNTATDLLQRNASKDVKCAAYVGNDVRLELSPLHAAAVLGNKEMAEALLRSGFALESAAEGTGRNVLHWAAIGGNLLLVKSLLSRGSRFIDLDGNGVSAMDLAKDAQRDEVAEFLQTLSQNELNKMKPLVVERANDLMRAGAKLDAFDASGKAKIHYIAGSDDADSLESILKLGIDIGFKDAYGNTPLHEAVSKKQVSQVQRLLKLGADPNAQNLKGETPLHLAIKGYLREIILILLSIKADTHIKDKNGHDALQIAKYYFSSEVVTHIETLRSLESRRRDEI